MLPATTKKLLGLISPLTSKTERELALLFEIHYSAFSVSSVSRERLETMMTYFDVAGISRPTEGDSPLPPPYTWGGYLAVLDEIEKLPPLAQQQIREVLTHHASAIGGVA